MKYILLLFLCFVFVLGLVYYLSDHSYLEGLVNLNDNDIDTIKNSIPNIQSNSNLYLLIKKDDKYLYLNPTAPRNRNNPMMFQNLDQYKIYKQEKN